MLIHFFCTGNKEEELDSDDLDDDSNEESDDEQEEGTSTGTETLNGLRRYMDQMDEELIGTKIGQSFSVKVNVFFLFCLSHQNSSFFLFTRFVKPSTHESLLWLILFVSSISPSIHPSVLS